MITAFGLVTLPLVLLCLNKPIRLLQLAILLSVFDAAAAVVVGTFGLTPGMVPSLAFISYVGLQYSLGMRFPGERRVVASMLPLLLLVCWAAFSAVVMPDLFRGAIMVYPGRLDPEFVDLVPLAFNTGNITQTVNLVLNVGLATAAALFLTRARIPYDSLLNAFLGSGYVVVLLCFWQFGSHYGGLPFPSDFIYSNPGRTVVEQSFGNVHRIQGPFSEPAALAFYLSGLTFGCLWLCLRGYRGMRPDLLLTLALAAVVLSTSTTGIVGTAIGLPLVLLVGLGAGARGALRQIARTGLVLFGAVMVVVVPLLLLKPELMDAVQLIIESTMAKQDSESFSERTETDLMAVEAMLDSFGLGVGWGSFRSSSLIPGLLANAGLPGMLLILLQGLAIWRLNRRAAGAGPHPARNLVSGYLAAAVGTVFAATLSAPTISTPAFYLFVGAAIGGSARMLVDWRQVAIRSRRPGARPALAEATPRPPPMPQSRLVLRGNPPSLPPSARQLTMS